MVGAGFFARFQAEAWGRLPGVEISAVADVDRARAETFAREWDIPRVYPDLRTMLDAEPGDFVDLVTRPETHRELAETASRAGRHVICQKPLAPTMEDCRAMVAACREAGVRLLVHENWRWQPWYREMRRLLDAGAAGTPFHLAFHMRTGDGRGPEPYGVQPYFREMERFLLQETVVHFLDTFRYLLGEVEQLYCQTTRVNPAIRGEDCALLQLRFHSGADGLIDANRTSGPVPPEVAFGSMRLEGDRGMLRLSPDGCLWHTEYGEPEREYVFPRPEVGYKGDSVRAFQEHALHCLSTGAPCESEGAEYLKTVALVFAAYRSAETGQAVAPEEPA